jgi:hypothetical protein
MVDCFGQRGSRSERQREGIAKLVVRLVRARPDSAWWHDYVMRAAEIRFVRDRLPG